MKRLLILGAGGYGRTVEDVARQLACYDEIFFLDDTQVGKPGILAGCQDVLSFVNEQTHVYPAFGNNEARMTWMRRLLDHGVHVPTLVHPTAYVSPRAVLATGVMVLPKAVVNTGVTVKTGCIINIGVLVDHDTVVEEGCHLAPGAIVKAENRIPAGSKINSGTVVENRQYPL